MMVHGIQKDREVREPFDMFQNMMLGPGRSQPGPGGPTGLMPGGDNAPPPPPNIFGKDELAGAAVVIDENGINAVESRSQFVDSGTYDDNCAKTLRITADDGHTGGVYVRGKDVTYTVEDAVIRLSGDSVGLGGMTSAIAADQGAELILKNADIVTEGTARSATSATNSAVLKIYDSSLLCHGADFSKDTIGPSGRKRDIQGNARCHITMGNARTYLYNTSVVADGWAALSTDIAQGYVYVEANDCHLETTKSGYTAYADGGCEVVLNRCEVKSASMAGVIAGEASITYRDCRIQSGTFGTKFHCIGQSAEVGTLNIENSTIRSADQNIIINSHNAEITVRNSELCADVALEVRVNDDPNAANAAAKGKQVYGVHLTLEGSKIQGDLRNTDDRATNVYLRDSRIRGAMHGITLWMQEGGFWFASGDSDVVLVGEFSLSQIDAPLGVTVHAFGAENVSYGLPSGGQLVISAR